MGEDRRVRWTHFEDAPIGTLERERFAEFRKPLADTDAEALDLSLIEVAPGEAGPMHAHHGTVEEVYVVLAGELEIDHDGGTVRGRPGTVCFFPPGATHRPVNRSDEPARLVTIRAGEGERTVEDEGAAGG